MAFKNNPWSNEEVTTFLCLVSDENIQRDLDGMIRNVRIFTEKSKQTLQFGYDRSPKQCREKLKKLKIGDILSSNSCQYCVLELMGSGVFGQVAKCLNETTKEMVAVKVFHNAGRSSEARWEIYFLKKISRFNHPNLVRFIEEFHYQGNPCLVLEILHKDILHTVKNHEWKMQLNKIRLIAKQLLMAINTLTKAGIVHGDLKPNNIMFVSKEHRKIKLIDFGLALMNSRLRTGVVLQATSYRAPEILLGLSFSHGIDMWGTGCIFAFLYLCHNLFRARCGYEKMRQVVQLLGQPEDRLLRQGIHTRKYFLEEEGPDGSAWRLKTPKECMSGFQDKTPKDIRDCKYKSLDDLVYIYPLTSPAELEDRHQFVDLLKYLLNVDSEKRISSFQALQHPFITMSHLLDPCYKSYLCDSMEMMGFCNDLYPFFAENNKSARPGSKHRGREHLEGETLKEPQVKKVVELQERTAPQITEGQQPETPESSKTASKNKSLKKMQFTWKKFKALRISSQ